MRFVTTAGMKELERQIAQAGVSYPEMMERAGQSAAKAILERWPVAGKRVLVLCGKGNNGGDGFVVARHLAEAGGAVTAALLCGRPATPESCAAYGQMPPSVAVTEDLSALPSRIWEAALLVDGVFGTGFSGSIPGELEPVFAAARQAQKTGTPVAALDLPSGVNGDTGEYESCIPADLVIAMGAAKPAHLVNWAGEYMKELTLGEIGAHPRVEDAFSGWQEALELCHVRRFLPRRSHTGHKGQNGRLLLIAGCRQYLGAAALATAAAVRSGAGYVRLASIPGAVKIVAARCPEAIYTLCKKNSQGGRSEERRVGKECAA